MKERHPVRLWRPVVKRLPGLRYSDWITIAFLDHDNPRLRNLRRSQRIDILVQLLTGCHALRLPAQLAPRCAFGVDLPDGHSDCS